MFSTLNKDDVSVVRCGRAFRYSVTKQFPACEKEEDTSGPLCELECHETGLSTGNPAEVGEVSPEVLGVRRAEHRSICKTSPRPPPLYLGIVLM